MIPCSTCGLSQLREDPSTGEFFADACECPLKISGTILMDVVVLEISPRMMKYPEFSTECMICKEVRCTCAQS